MAATGDIVIALLVTCGWSLLVVNGNNEKQLFRDLFEDYEPSVRPRKNPLETVEVEVELELHQMKGLDEKNEILSTIGFIEATWYDDYLRWNPDDYGGVEELVVPPDKIWQPDFGIQNSADAFYDEIRFEHFRVWMDHNGTVKSSFGGLFQTACDLDTTFYPVDIQTCKIRVENWCYSVQFVNLVNLTSDVPLNDFYPHGLWTIVGTSAEREEIFFESDPENPFTRVTFEIRLKRKPRYYIINLVVPCCLLTFISLLVYVLPPESGEKIGLGVTVLLAFSVFQFVITDHTPVDSDSTPLLSIFVVATMGLSTLSVITSVLVLHIHLEASNYPIPHWIRVVAFQYVSPLVGMGVYHSSTEATMATDNNGSEDNNFELQLVGDEVPHRVTPLKDATDVTSCLSGCSHVAELRHIRARFDRLTTYIDMKKSRLIAAEAANVVSEDWRALAKIVDRLLLNITIISIIVSGIFVSVYGHFSPDHIERE